MRTKAKVISLDGEIAVVETQRVSACEGCHKAEEGKGCSVCTLMGASDRALQAKASNRVGARVGDTVWIESATSRMMFYAVLVFLLPLFMALVGFGVAFAVTENSTWHIIGGAIGFVLSFLFVFVYSRSVGKTRCDIEITEVISSMESQNENFKETFRDPACDRGSCDDLVRQFCHRRADYHRNRERALFRSYRFCGL